MRKLTLLTFAALLFVNVATAQEAKSAKQISREREEVLKLSRAELDQRASRDARKESKSLAKDGWKSSPGALPIEKQLDRSYLMQYEFDESGYPKYLFGEAMSTARVYDAAKSQALELAKINLAAQVQTEVLTMIENTVANNQLGQQQAATVAESVMASKGIITQSIGRTITAVETFRQLKNGNVEVLVRIAYNADMARKSAIDAVRKDLESKGNDLHNKLDNLMTK